MKKTLLLATLLLIAPNFAFASSHKYTCSDFGATEGTAIATCSGDVWTIPNSAGSASFTIDSTGSTAPPNAGNTAHYPLTYGTHYYVYIGSVGGSGHFMVGGRYYTTSPYYFDYSNTNINSSPFTYDFVSSASTGAGIFFGAQDSSGFTPVYTGTIGDFCISDISTADAQALCSPPPPPNLDASTTVAQVDNPNLDIFFGFLMFYGTMWSIIMIFKKK